MKYFRFVADGSVLEPGRVRASVRGHRADRFSFYAGCARLLARACHF
jgi:hypothetical protein